MAYEIRKSDGTFLVSVVDGTVNSTTTTIKLIGRGYPNYGDELNNNLVHMLEHFANDTSPANPLVGQIWLDSNVDQLKFWNGSTWETILSSASGSTQFVEKAGDDMTGPLVIDTASIGLTSYPGTAGLISEGVTVANADTTSRTIDLATYNKPGLGRRWRLRATNEVETGSNAGSNFRLERYNDSDALIDYVMRINRASGDFDFNGHRLTNIGAPLSANDAATQQYVDSTVSSAVATSTLIGEIKMIAGTTVPTGWLSCNGAAISRTTYSLLFAEIGTTYGIGNGSTTFNLPNTAGRVPVSTGDSGTTGSFNIGLGVVGGTAAHQLTIPEMPSHTHPFVAALADADAEGGNGDREPTNRNLVTAATGGDQPHENMPPYIGFNFIIYAGA